MQKFEEIKEIMSVENEETDAMRANIQKIFNNAFIKDCDEYGIKKYEKLLGILPNLEDTIESRRSRVLMQWNNYTLLTYRMIVQKLIETLGDGNFKLSGHTEDYEFLLNTKCELFGQIEELEHMLEKILPSNIYYHIENTIEAKTESSIMLGCAVTQTIEYSIKERM